LSLETLDIAFDAGVMRIADWGSNAADAACAATWAGRFVVTGDAVWALGQTAIDGADERGAMVICAKRASVTGGWPPEPADLSVAGPWPAPSRAEIDLRPGSGASSSDSRRGRRFDDETTDAGALSWLSPGRLFPPRLATRTSGIRCVAGLGDCSSGDSTGESSSDSGSERSVQAVSAGPRSLSPVRDNQRGD
jgi:hypothetical protein